MGQGGELQVQEKSEHRATSASRQVSCRGPRVRPEAGGPEVSPQDPTLPGTA